MLDEIMDFFSDAWDNLLDILAYIFTFEWIGDIGDFFGSMFENIGEFSIVGLVFGMIGFATVYLARDYMLKPFLIHFSPLWALIWGGVTYVGCFIAGYFVGKYFENTG